jgi:hypothetical protein
MLIKAAPEMCALDGDAETSLATHLENGTTRWLGTYLLDVMLVKKNPQIDDGLQVPPLMQN